MENASKALLMAAGVLLGILLLALMVTLFASSSSLTKSYDQAKQAEAVQQYNAAFTKYLGKDLTIHEVKTILNYANSIGLDPNNIDDSSVEGFRDTVDGYKPSSNNPVAPDGSDNNVTKYELSVEYNSSGYIYKIKFIKK